MGKKVLAYAFLNIAGQSSGQLCVVKLQDTRDESDIRYRIHFLASRLGFGRDIEQDVAETVRWGATLFDDVGKLWLERAGDIPDAPLVI